MKIGGLVKILSGFAFDSSLFNEDGNGIPIIRIRDVGKNSVSTYYSGQYSNDYIIKKGDFLIGMDGDFRLSKWYCEDALLNQRVCKVEVISNELFPLYLFYFLPKELKKIEDSTSFATVKHLSVKKIQDIDIPLPPLEQQKKIAAILDAADAYRQKTKALIAKYDELTQSLFLDMFGDPVKNEKGWEKVRFDELVSSDCPLTYGIVQPGDEVDEGVPCVRPVDLVSQYVKVDTLKKIDPIISSKFRRTILKGGELLLSVRGSVGVISIADNSLEGSNVTRGIVPIWFDLNISNKLFFYYLYNSKEIQREVKGLAKGATLIQINLKDLRELKVIKPPIDFQNQFAERVQAIEQQKAQAQAGLEKAEELFNSLLQRAFKGELV